MVRQFHGFPEGWGLAGCLWGAAVILIGTSSLEPWGCLAWNVWGAGQRTLCPERGSRKGDQDLVGTPSWWSAGLVCTRLSMWALAAHKPGTAMDTCCPSVRGMRMRVQGHPQLCVKFQSHPGLDETVFQTKNQITQRDGHKWGSFQDFQGFWSHS